MEGRGALVVFATEAGRTAGDAPGSANSIFTQHLLEGLRMQGISLDDAMKKISRDVARATQEKQVPAIYGLLLDDVVLLPGTAPAAGPASAPAPVPSKAGPISRAAGSPATPAGSRRFVQKANVPYVWIPPGRFLMGCSEGDKECRPNEPPSHEIAIANGFWMETGPVTVKTWKRYRQMTGAPALAASDGKGHDHLNEAGGEYAPVVMVTRPQAQDFCRWVVGGRLPTDEEWEYAARAGTTGPRYGDLDAIGWYDKNSGNAVHPVTRKQPNAWGLYDMLGKVWQWTTSGDRGGAWNNPASVVRVSATGGSTGAPTYIIGFRCVADSLP
jgi:formylglycine-generating enzyme required for sulfatase activity